MPRLSGSASRAVAQASKLATLLSLGAIAAIPLVTPTDAAAAPPADARGGYLVAVLGCADCHAPLKMGSKGPERDMSRGLSGHPEQMSLPPAPPAQGPWVMGGTATNTAFYGPWGVTYAANLTPDRETGIGGWKVEDFIRAIKDGRHAGVGRPIMPPMPIEAYRNLTETDLRHVFAHLVAQPAVKNRVPDYQPPTAPSAARR